MGHVTQPQPRIVTPQEAEGLRNRLAPDGDSWASVMVREGLLNDVLTTVATEPDRIRAAVFKALRWAADMYGVDTLNEDALRVAHGGDL